jgi:asparagine synthetase B (glutamine-hydrolysing)
MCGIHAVICPSSEVDGGPDPVLRERLSARGPDHYGTVHQVIEGDGCDDPLDIRLTSTVLSLRGDHIAKQPLVDETSGSALCWNGEVWRLDGRTLEGNDTEAIFQLLLDASARRGAAGAASDPVLEALRLIEGPFAFIYLDRPAKRLYVGRDRLGRRSLLMRRGMPFTLSSIAEPPSEDWVEVEADGCYTVQLDQWRDPNELTMLRHGWHEDDNLVS